MTMPMTTWSRWLLPTALAAALGFAGAVTPAPARAQDGELVRVLVNLADVVLRGGQPYYRYGNYSRDDRLIVGRDRHGRKVYYRLVPVASGAARAYRTTYGRRDVKCNKHGKCKVTYYDPRYDRDRRYGRHGRDWDDDDDRDWDDRRRWDDDDD